MLMLHRLLNDASMCETYGTCPLSGRPVGHGRGYVKGCLRQMTAGLMALNTRRLVGSPHVLER